MLTWHDVLYYVRLFLRWWFVIALSVALAVGTAWVLTRQQPDTFASQAALMVGNNFEVAAPSQAQVALSNVLADYYAALVKREVILGPVVERLQLSFGWTVIRDRMLQTRIDRGANLLEIKITDTNPDRAAAIANAISEQLIAYTPNAPEKIAAQQAEISRQLNETQANIQAVEAKIAELEGRLANLSSAIDISDVQSQLEALQRTRQRYLDEYANLINLSNQTSVNTLSLFEPARPAVEPLPKKRALTLAIAGGGGLLMAIVACLILDRLDERWRNGSELLSRTGIRSLGDVPEGPPPTPGLRPGGPARHQALNNVFSNMILAAQSKLPRTLLVSSPQASPARSAMAIDLAEMYTRTGHRVLLVDTESESAYIPGLLGPHLNGAAAASFGGASFEGQGSIWSYVRPSSIPNLLVLSGREAGYDRFSSLVPLVFWPDMLSHLRKAADVVIFDGPGALTGPEASLLAPLVDGVLLVLNGKQDSRSTAIKARKQLTSEADSKFLGAIVTSWTGQARREPARLGAKGGNFRIALGRDGITITLGQARGALGASASGVASAPKRLPSPPPRPEPAAATVGEVVPNHNGASSGDDHVTWEDLLELEIGGAPQQRTVGEPAVQTAAVSEARSPVVISATGAIITPPPAPAAAPEESAPRPERQRRARIANSRRAGRAARTSFGAARNGAERG